MEGAGRRCHRRSAAREDSTGSQQEIGYCHVAIKPRGQKSKLRARKKRNQTRSIAFKARNAESMAAEGEEPSAAAALLSDDKVEEALVASCANAVASHSRSADGDGSQVNEGASTSGGAASNKSMPPEYLCAKVGVIMHLLLEKYKKETVTRFDMVRLVTRRFRGQFSEIHKRAAEWLELVFGLDLKEVKSRGQAFWLVSKLQLSGSGSGGCRLPKNGLLMPLLGVIFLNGNSKKEIWEFLNILGVYEGHMHIIFGDPKKLLTEDLIEEKYLEYHQVRESNTPTYEFLWGERAYTETSKMKVLEFLAKVNGTNPQAFPAHYEEAFREEEEKACITAEAKAAARAAGKAAVRAITKTKANARSRVKFIMNTSHP